MPANPRLPLPKALYDDAVRKSRVEFVMFFNGLLDPKGRWPGMTHEMFTDVLASALVEVGGQDKLGKALLQTFIYDLQEHCNKHP